MHKVIRYFAFSVATLYATTALAGGLTTDAKGTSSTTKPATSTTIDTTTPTTTPTTTQAQATATNSGTGFVAIEDDPLIVDASSIIDEDGIGEISVQWQIVNNANDWTNISGATQQSFTPRQVHVGHLLRVVISYVDGQGNLETIISPASSPVQNVNDKPTGAAIMTGNAYEDDALVVGTSTIADEDGIGSYDVSWQRSSSKTEWQAYPDATSEVLRLGQPQVGYSYRAIIKYVDGHGAHEVLISNPSETVINVDDPVEGELILTGEPLEGEQITVGTSTISDEDVIASLSLSWEASKDGRNWRAVETTSSNAIALNQSVVGMQVRAKANVVDSFGVETVIYSKPSNTVKNVNSPPAGKIIVRRVGS